jgi:hypothetical protein
MADGLFAADAVAQKFLTDFDGVEWATTPLSKFVPGWFAKHWPASFTTWQTPPTEPSTGDLIIPADGQYFVFFDGEWSETVQRFTTGDTLSTRITAIRQWFRADCSVGPLIERPTIPAGQWTPESVRACEGRDVVIQGPSGKTLFTFKHLKAVDIARIFHEDGATRYVVLPEDPANG